MSEKETAGGLWHTCTLEGLASRKEELLKEVVEALEFKGFKLKHGWNSLRNEILPDTSSINVVLTREKNKLEIELFTEALNTNLRFSYSYNWKTEKQRPTWQWVIFIGLWIGIGFLLMPIYMPSEPSMIRRITHSPLVDAILTIVWVSLIFSLFIPILKHEYVEKKISKYITATIQTMTGMKSIFKLE